MSSKPSFLLTVDKQAWSVVRVMDDKVETRSLSVADGATDQQMAKAAADTLRQWQYDGQGICLGLPSSCVFTASIDTSDLGRKYRRQTMLYRLEEQLPLEAESLTADFITTASGAAMGVAVRTGAIKPITDELAAQGVQIGSICPASLLALWNTLQNSNSDADFVLISWPSGQDLFAVSSAQPLRWLSTTDPKSLIGLLHGDLLVSPIARQRVRIRLVGQLPASVAADLAGGIPAEIIADPQDPLTSAAGSLKQVLAGRPAWVELLREGLAPASMWEGHRRKVKAIAAMAVILVLVTIGMLLVRGWRYSNLSQQYVQSQADEYARLYPNSPIPWNVKSRFQSQCDRLAGVSGIGKSLPSQVNSLETLRRAMASLPPDVKLRISEVRVGPTGIFLEGRVLGHSDAAAISTALKKGGFEADPPRTEQLPKGEVSFTVSAKLAQSTTNPSSRPLGALK